MHTPRKAMVLAAGLGTRMRPLTDHLPKPLVKVGSRPLIDHVLDRLAEVGVETAIVNVHYLADMLEAHLRQRQHPQIVVSNEREQLLDTGGGVMQSLPELGDDPFFHLNADNLWRDQETPNLLRLAQGFQPQQMLGMLLLAPREGSVGYHGAGDFHLQPDGQIIRRRSDETADHVYAGVAILHPLLFRNAPQGAFSLNLLLDQAIREQKLYGLPVLGEWMHIGTPEAVEEANRVLRDSIR